MKPIDELTNGQHSKDVADGICTRCRKKVGEFRNEISKKEHTISGFCQGCQDSFFGKD